MESHTIGADRVGRHKKAYFNDVRTQCDFQHSEACSFAI
jgi:hypothetical protein